MSDDNLPFDPVKDAENIRRHGMSLAQYAFLDVIAFLPDRRFPYGEERFRAWGTIDGESHCLAYTVKDGRVRPISLRRAHAKEMKRHVRST